MKTPSANKDAKQLDHSYIADGNLKCYNHPTNQFVSHEIKHAYNIQPSNDNHEHLAQRYKNVYPHKNLYMNVYRNSISKGLNWNQNPDVLQ